MAHYSANQSNLHVRPVEDLMWLYWASETEMGVSAQAYGPSTTAVAMDSLAAGLMPGWVSAPPPDLRQVAATSKERRIRAALAELSPHQQSAIEIAYGHRYALWCAADHNQQLPVEERVTGREAARERAEYVTLTIDWGIAAGLVVAVLRQRGSPVGRSLNGSAPAALQAARLLEGAHAAYRDAKTRQRAAQRQQLAKARQAGNLGRQRKLAAALELGPRVERRLEAIRWLREAGIEVEGIVSELVDDDTTADELLGQLGLGALLEELKP